MSEILDAVNGEGPYAKDKGEISTTAPHGNTLDPVVRRRECQHENAFSVGFDGTGDWCPDCKMFVV